VLWGNGLQGSAIDAVVKRPMSNCPGAEILKELFQFQSVEVHGDAVFAVETSACAALEAVCSPAKSDKDMLEVVSARCDIRYDLSRLDRFSSIAGGINERDPPRTTLRGCQGKRRGL
jgi:myosin-crossreactive antigen